MEALLESLNLDGLRLTDVLQKLASLERMTGKASKVNLLIGALLGDGVSGALSDGLNGEADTMRLLLDNGLADRL